MCLYHNQKESQHDNSAQSNGWSSNSIMPQMSVDNSYIDSLFMSQVASVPGSPAMDLRMESESVVKESCMGSCSP